MTVELRKEILPRTLTKRQFYRILDCVRSCKSNGEKNDLHKFNTKFKVDFLKGMNMEQSDWDKLKPMKIFDASTTNRIYTTLIRTPFYFTESELLQLLR